VFPKRSIVREGTDSSHQEKKKGAHSQAKKPKIQERTKMTETIEDFLELEKRALELEEADDEDDFNGFIEETFTKKNSPKSFVERKYPGISIVRDFPGSSDDGHGKHSPNTPKSSPPTVPERSISLSPPHSNPSLETPKSDSNSQAPPIVLPELTPQKKCDARNCDVTRHTSPQSLIETPKSDKSDGSARGFAESPDAGKYGPTVRKTKKAKAVEEEDAVDTTEVMRQVTLVSTHSKGWPTEDYDAEDIETFFDENCIGDEGVKVEGAGRVDLSFGGEVSDGVEEDVDEDLDLPDDVRAQINEGLSRSSFRASEMENCQWRLECSPGQRKRNEIEDVKVVKVEDGNAEKKGNEVECRREAKVKDKCEQKRFGGEEDNEDEEEACELDWAGFKELMMVSESSSDTEEIPRLFPSSSDSDGETYRELLRKYGGV
jgi:hypothetical protein